MSIAPVDISLELKNQKVKFVGVSKTRPESPITMDYIPPLGDGEGFVGIELLAMSFSGCVSTAITTMLRKAGKSFTSYKMHLLGIKHESPLYLEKIEFEVTVESVDIIDEDMVSAINKAEQISPVWLAIKNNVAVSWSYRILKAE